MKIGMIGGSGVGQTLAAALKAQGHDVVVGIRDVTPEALGKDRGYAKPLNVWTVETGVPVVTMADAASHGEVLFNVTSGQASIAALTAAGASNLAGKLLVDVANPLDFSAGMPPFLATAYTGPSSLAEQIQAAFPDARVVKAFNTIAAPVMVNPALIPGDHDLFIAGNDAAAKAQVSAIATAFGWKHIVDLGDIVGARATEALLPIWVRLWGTTGGMLHNLHLAKA